MKACAFVVMLVAMLAVMAGADTALVDLSADGIPVKDAAAEITRQCGVRVMCDTDVVGTVTGSFSGMDVEKLLDLITKSNQLVWQKIYLPERPEEKLTVEQVKAQAETVRAITEMPIVIYDPATKKQTVLLKQDTGAAAITPDSLGLKPIYFISKPKSDVPEPPKSGADESEVIQDYQRLQNDRLRLLSEMTPEQRVQMMQHEMLQQMNLDPVSRAELTKAQVQAMRTMDPQTREKYRQTMRETFRELRQQGVITGGRGGWGGRGGRDGQREQ